MAWGVSFAGADGVAAKGAVHTHALHVAQAARQPPARAEGIFLHVRESRLPSILFVHDLSQNHWSLEH